MDDYDGGVYGALHSAFRKLPPHWRATAKRLLGTEGHGESAFDWLTARKDATGKKRLDKAIGGLISTIGAESVTILTGKTCIDFGAGYVPTDGMAMWLLGASEVHGVDYNNIAKPAEMARAVRAADLDRVQTQLRSLPIDAGWPERLDRLTRWAAERSRSFPPGYNYHAPLDVIAAPGLLPPFDILVSTSVLEHIPPSRMVPLIDALKSRENDGAMQFHRVDLRDHRDFENDPYGFLDLSVPFDSEAEADSRGNAMTVQDWERLLEDHPSWRLAVGEYQTGRPHLLADTARAVTVVADWLVLRSVLEQRQ